MRQHNGELVAAQSSGCGIMWDAFGYSFGDLLEEQIAARCESRFVGAVLGQPRSKFPKLANTLVPISDGKRLSTPLNDARICGMECH